MLDNTRNLQESNRGLSKNRGLNTLDRGLYDITVKKTILKSFSRDELFDDAKLGSGDPSESKDPKDEKESMETPRKYKSSSSSSSSSSSMRSPVISLKKSDSSSSTANQIPELDLNDLDNKKKIPRKKDNKQKIVDMKSKV